MEVKVATIVAEVLDDALERWARIEAHELAEATRDANVTRRKDVEAP